MSNIFLCLFGCKNTKTFGLIKRNDGYFIVIDTYCFSSWSSHQNRSLPLFSLRFSLYSSSFPCTLRWSMDSDRENQKTVFTFFTFAPANSQRWEVWWDGWGETAWRHIEFSWQNNEIEKKSSLFIKRTYYAHLQYVKYMKRNHNTSWHFMTLLICLRFAKVTLFSLTN